MSGRAKEKGLTGEQVGGRSHLGEGSTCCCGCCYDALRQAFGDGLTGEQVGGGFGSAAVGSDVMMQVVEQGITSEQVGQEHGGLAPLMICHGAIAHDRIAQRVLNRVCLPTANTPLLLLLIIATPQEELLRGLFAEHGGSGRTDRFELIAEGMEDSLGRLLKPAQASRAFMEHGCIFGLMRVGDEAMQGPRAGC